MQLGEVHENDKVAIIRNGYKHQADGVEGIVPFSYHSRLTHTRQV